MKLAIKTALVLGFLMGTAWAFQQVVKHSTFVDESYGYTIETPRFPGGPTSPNTPLVVKGPMINGYPPNVNVSVQSVVTTAKAYRDHSVEQFIQAKVKVNSERRLQVSGRDAIEFDYEGVLGGTKPLHYLSMSVIDTNRVIIVTCTTTPETFALLEPEFRTCLASFRLP